MKQKMLRLLPIILVLPLTIRCSDDADYKYIGKPILVVRPQYQSAMPERIVRTQDIMFCDDDRGGELRFTLFGGRSTSEELLSHYFGPVAKNSFTAKDIDPDINEITDLDVSNFNILTNSGHFESKLKFKPRQATLGLGITYRQDLSHLWNKCGHCCNVEKPFWLELSTPLTYLRNNMNLEEKILDDGNGAVETIEGIDQEFYGSMKTAFNQKAWKYGKIDDAKKMTKWRLADIELKIGRTSCQEEKYGFEWYVGVLIPTGNKPTAEYVFEPLVGHLGHWGASMGGTAYWQLWKNDCNDRFITFYTDSHAHYLFSKKELRSFDLKTGPWTRYLEVYENIDQAQQAFNLSVNDNSAAGIALSSPGINFFTQDLKVRPRLACTNNMALEYASDCFTAEIGYNCYIRQAQCVELDKSWKEGVAIKGSNGEGSTNKYRLIGNAMAGMENQQNPAIVGPRFDASLFEKDVIKEADLDLESAANPAVTSHTLYGVLGYRWADKEYPCFIRGGGSYEFEEDNNVLRRWTVWATLGFMF